MQVNNFIDDEGDEGEVCFEEDAAVGVATDDTSAASAWAELPGAVPELTDIQPFSEDE